MIGKSKHTPTERKIDSIWISGINGDQTVSFRLTDTRFLILHGRNGSGKTQALRIIDAILNVNIIVLSYYSFNHAQIYFEDGARLLVTRDDTRAASRSTVFTFTWGTDGNDSTEVISVDDLEIAVAKTLLANRLDSESFYWEIKSEYNFLPAESSRMVSSDTIQKMLNSLDGVSRRSLKGRGIMSQIAKVRATLTGAHCQFIGTHRLVAGGPFYQRDTPPTDSARLSSFLPIEHLATRMQDYIDHSIEESEAIRAKFDAEFPERIFEVNKDEHSPFVDIMDYYENIDDKRKQIQEELGVDLGPTGFTPRRNVKLHPLLENVAHIYLKGQQEQLKPLENLLEKVSVFRRLINVRLWRKAVSVSRKYGLRVHPVSDPGDRITSTAAIPLEKLSTGEQHEIYLFFNLVFADDNPTLILIDEPEISLHVAWQRAFIDDILEASKFTEPRFIIATHSPQIIGSRQDQLVTFNEFPSRSRAQIQ